ncbi:helix-turn-helix domain-containing protein [Streptomyces sp. NPDC001594]|uniref:helix-turn-helix domain-containing protein n=1 Tax=Streptomyces sp. NPDC001594 TaxID=3364590 RepID=UPI0036CE9A50
MERIVEEIREDLDRRIALAADRLTDRTLAREPAWAVPLGRAGVRERIRLVLRRILDGLVGACRGEPVDVADARAAGAERAGRGLPLDPLRRTYREGARLVWQCLTEAVAVHDRSALARLPAGPDALWDVVDRLTDAASEAYHRAGAEREDGERERRAALLDALLDGPGAAGADPEPALAAAVRLGLPERGRFAVVALAPPRPGTAGPGGPGGAADGAAGVADAPRVLWRVRADGETGVAELGHHPLESLRVLLAPLPVRAGISPVVASPAELAGARRLAALALRVAPTAPAGSGAALLDERLPAALVAADPELAARLREVVLGPVLALPGQEARVLLTTLGTWLACQGSTTYAAQRLYCHRNTVSNRLRRLEQLTGRTLSDPAHVVELALAHAALAHAPAAPRAKAGPPPADPAAGGGGPTPGGTARRSPRSPG